MISMPPRCQCGHVFGFHNSLGDGECGVGYCICEAFADQRTGVRTAVHKWEYLGGGGPEGGYDVYECAKCRISVHVHSRAQLKAPVIPICTGVDKFERDRRRLPVLQYEIELIERKLRSQHITV